MPRGRPYKCIYCGSAATVSKGVRVTKTLGIRKIRRCKSCGRKFTPKNQKVVAAERDQANEAQTESVNEGPAEELVPNQLKAPVPTEPEEPLSADQQEAGILDPEESTNGH